MITFNLDDLACSAFNAYRFNRELKDVRGGEIPVWQNVSEEVKNGWRVAVMQAIEVYAGGSFGLGVEEKWKGWKQGNDSPF